MAGPAFSASRFEQLGLPAIAGGWRLGWPSLRAAIEHWLEAERDQLVLWVPVALGAGVAAWFVASDPVWWSALALGCAGAGLAALALGRDGRLARMLATAFLLAAAGVALAWWRAERVAAPVLAHAVMATIEGRVERVEPQPARDRVRLRLVPTGPDAATLPAHIRVNLDTADVPAAIGRGAVVRMKARLMPPPRPAVPGAYDAARAAWFDSLGATGHGFAPVTVLVPAGPGAKGLRERLTSHIEAQLAGGPGAIAAALVTGDTGAIPDSDNDAMRRAGLAHLLSISGLHVTAVIVAVMLLVTRLLALSPWLALHWPLRLVGAGAGAAAAIAYTILSGSEVPTIRSCVASLLVLLALALGRQAITLRLVAAGAFVILAVWPEALAGPSFQLSFAAVTALIALHEHPCVHGWFEKREEGRAHRVLREAVSLLFTGLVVELALAPIALYHFHREGLYGALANIVAIPLTTFVTMPAEALALLLDAAGLGAAAWWVAGLSLRLLLWIAHLAAHAPGSVAMLPAMPSGAFALMVAGMLWLALWRTRPRVLGVGLFAAGALWSLLTPPPDLLVSDDGRHLALRTPAGQVAMLRDRTGDYMSDTLAENGGVDGAPLLLAEQPFARCSADSCIAEREAGRRRWRILATRSAYPIPIADLVAACAAADIAISERRLPRTCRPRWLKLDKPTLRKSGGLAITFATGRIVTTLDPADHHPWALPGTMPGPARAPSADEVNRSGAGAPRVYPARGPGPEHNAADHRHG